MSGCTAGSARVTLACFEPMKTIFGRESLCPGVDTTTGFQRFCLRFTRLLSSRTELTAASTAAAASAYTRAGPVGKTIKFEAEGIFKQVMAASYVKAAAAAPPPRHTGAA